MRKLLYIIVAVVLLTMLLPAAALAGDELDVVAWAYPDSVNDGEQTTISIQINNNTGKRVMLTAYGVDNDFYQIGEGTYLDDGASTMIEHVYTANFSANGSIAVPVQVNYDDGAGGVVMSFADQVTLVRADALTLDFLVTPDANGIAPGTYVNFTIECTNTGSFDYTDFTVTAGSADFETFDLAVGQTQTVVFSECYFDDTLQDLGYYFYYNGGMLKFEEPAVTISITVLKGETPTQQPADTNNSAAASSSNTAAPSPTNSSNASQDDAQNASQNQPQEEPQDEPESGAVLVSEQSDDENAEKQSSSTKEDSGNTLVITLIVAGAVLATGVVILSILLVKRSKRSSIGSRDGGAI